MQRAACIPYHLRHCTGLHLGTSICSSFTCMHLLPRPPFLHPGLGRWDDAVECFGKAAALSPSFAFASANQALALYQVTRLASQAGRSWQR